MPKLKKRSDGRYCLSVTLNGQRKFFYGATQREAQEKFDAYMDKASDLANYDCTISLQEWAQVWLTIKSNTVSNATLHNYRDTVDRYIVPYIGHIKLCDLSVANVRFLINKLEEKNYSSRTVSYAYTILNAIMRQAVNDELVEKNVVAKVTKPTKKKIKTLSTLTAVEVQQFLGVIENEEHHAFFKVAFTTGLRRSELLGLRWADIDFDKSMLTVNQTVLRIGNEVVISPTTKTSSSRRSISIDTETLMVLKRHRVTLNKRRIMTNGWINNDLIFPGANGSPWYPSYVSALCKKYARAINRPDFSMHGTRHTHATLLIENGVNFKIIQMRLGHASYAETMDTYSHITPIMEADVIDKIENIF